MINFAEWLVMHVVKQTKIIHSQMETSTLARHGSSKSHLTALKQLQLQSQFKKAVANVKTEHE